MNILYISPYRNTITQAACINNIKSLEKSSTLNIKPVYIDNYITDVTDKQTTILENKLSDIEKYDIVVQHAPIEFLLPFKLISSKNYCIPIMKYIKGNYSEYSKLSEFDMVLFDSKYDIDFISTNIGFKLKKTKLFKYKNYYEDSKDSKLDLQNHNYNYKLYIFVNDDSSWLINSVLTGFIISLQDVTNCSLIIVADSKSSAKKVSNILDSIENKNFIKYLKNYINILVINPADIHSIATIHNTCDCLIDIKNISNISVHSFIAKEFGKPSITNDNIDLYFEPIIDNDSEYGNAYPMISPTKLSNKIRSIVRTNYISKIDNIPTLDNILCH